MGRAFCVACTALVLLAAPGGFAQTGSSAAGGAAPPQNGAMPKPVNLKVLPPDIAHEDLMRIMHGYTQQLGVHCSFCHAEDAAAKRPDFASDAKPEKNTARTMMRMTDEINAKYLAQIHDPDAAAEQKIVSCGTCHQGHSMPPVFHAADAAPAHP